MALLERTYPPVVSFGARPLTRGEAGTDVAVLQSVYNQMLEQMNPPQGPIGQPIPLTGTYDEATQEAVKRIQAYFGLPADGVAGPATYFLFGQGVGPHLTYGGPAYGSRTLSLGSQGGDVTVLQNRLNCFRYSGTLGGPADGIFGPQTVAAVLQFQSDANANGDAGVGVDGILGPVTADATWLYTYAGGRHLFPGRHGFDVVFAQVVLKRLGFYGGAIDGMYGAKTDQAVQTFQAANGITPAGVIESHTFHALGRNNPLPAPQPLPLPPVGTPAPPPHALQVSTLTEWTAPVGQTCAFPLSPTPAAKGMPRTGVALIHNDNPPAAGAQFLAAALLTPPSTYGPQFVQYAVSGVTEAGAFGPHILKNPGGHLWAYDRIDPAVPPVRQISVSIAPATADTGLGPTVLQGGGNCPSAADAAP